MPIRREGDKRIEIADWDTWIERELADAEMRGEFEELPQAGRPIQLTKTDVNPEWDFAFSRLKNAGVMPAWMEADAACSRGRTELNAFLERSAAYLAARIHELEHPLPAPEPEPRPWWDVPARVGVWLRLPSATAAVVEPPLDRLDLVRMRLQMKEQYRERAAALDKQIVEFNNVLPPQLRHLERMRMLPDRASKLFAMGCPEVPFPEGDVAAEHPDA